MSTISWSRLKLTGATYHIVTMNTGMIQMKSNLSCEAVSPREGFCKPSGRDRIARMIFGSTHCYKHEVVLHGSWFAKSGTGPESMQV